MTAGNSVLTSTYCLSLFLAPRTHLAGAGGSGPSELLTFVTGLVIGVLTIAAAVAIALWQRIIQLHDRAAEREQENARRREQAAHEARISRRQAWQAEYEDIRKLLDCGETLAYRIRHDGPYDAARLAVLDIATFRMNAERLAERGVDQLRDPLLQLARKADELAQHAVPDETGLTVALSRSEVPHGMELHRVQRLAVLQDGQRKILPIRSHPHGEYSAKNGGAERSAKRRLHRIEQGSGTRIVMFCTAIAMPLISCRPELNDLRQALIGDRPIRFAAYMAAHK
jgi:hypothetical protein